MDGGSTDDTEGGSATKRGLDNGRWCRWSELGDSDGDEAEGATTRHLFSRLSLSSGTLLCLLLWFFCFFLSWKWDPRGAGLVEEGRRAVVAGSIAVKAGRVSVCKGRAGFGKGRVFKKQKG